MEIIKSIQKIVNTTADGIWGPKTQAAVASVLGCNNNVKDIQKLVGTTVDGILGPKSYAAILEKLQGKECNCSCGYDVFLDPGHTADYGREHPCQFNESVWNCAKGKEIACKLGFTSKTNDSVEHMLNVSICDAVKDECEKLGMTVYMYDNPSLSNNSEITQVYTKVNELKPKKFVSIHNNACGSSGWKNLACCATGTVGLYKEGRINGKNLAKAIADALIELRKSTGGPHNRACSVNTTNVAVLNHAPSNIPSALIEVGFYDNIDDLHWMATHIKEIGKTIANVLK